MLPFELLNQMSHKSDVEIFAFQIKISVDFNLSISSWIVRIQTSKLLLSSQK